MNDYKETLELLGLPDQNLPVFKESRLSRLQSIDKILGLINLSKRLSPQLPKRMLHLDPNDPEWEDKMIYPYVDYWALCKQGCYWLAFNAFFVYNWSTIMGNRRLRQLKLVYPLASSLMIAKMYYDHSSSVLQVGLFERYVQSRAE